MRPVEPERRRERWAERLQCSEPGCTRPTRERKPFCTEHISRSTYVRGLLETLESVESERAKVRRRGSRAVDPGGITAQEILRELRQHGDRTSQRLSRDLKLEVAVIDAYLEALARQGEIDLRPGNRGHKVASPKVA